MTLLRSRFVSTPLPEIRGREGASATALLRRCPLFCSFSEEEIATLAETAETLSVARGETVFRQGEPGEHLFLIASGSMRLSTSTREGFEQPIALLGPGSCFGEMALLDGEPRSATATAARASELLRVGRASLEGLSRRHPESREKFLREGVRVVSSRLRSANERYWGLAGRTLKAKADVAQTRSRLLSLVSHEFRTPLTIIKSSAQLLRRDVVEPQASFVEKILVQSRRLEVLVDDLIALSMLQAGSRISELKEVDLGEMAGQIVAEMSKQAGNKGLRISVIQPKAAVTVLADGALVRRAVRHLVDNAVKFSPASGNVVVETANAEQDRCRLSVRDQGSGINSEALGRLLQSFVQEQDPLNRDVEGLGIGLALATEVARAHGGRLLVDSVPGSGSCFAIELPCDPGNGLGLQDSEERNGSHE